MSFSLEDGKDITIYKYNGRDCVVQNPTLSIDRQPGRFLVWIVYLEDDKSLSKIEKQVSINLLEPTKRIFQWPRQN